MLAETVLTLAVVPMLGYLYFEDEQNKIPTLQADTIKASLSIGMILGQLGCELSLFFPSETPAIFWVLHYCVLSHQRSKLLTLYR
jgi:hypothetical protein